MSFRESIATNFRKTVAPASEVMGPPRSSIYKKKRDAIQDMGFSFGRGAQISFEKEEIPVQSSGLQFGSMVLPESQSEL